MPAVSVTSDVYSFHLFSFIFDLSNLTHTYESFSSCLLVSFTSSNLWRISTQFSKEFTRWGLLISNFFFGLTWAVFQLFSIHCRAWILESHKVGVSLVRIMAMQERLTCRKTQPPVNALISPITIPSESAFFVHLVVPENNFMLWFSVWTKQSLHFHQLTFQTQPQCPFSRS